MSYKPFKRVGAYADFCTKLVEAALKHGIDCYLAAEYVHSDKEVRAGKYGDRAELHVWLVEGKTVCIQVWEDGGFQPHLQAKGNKITDALADMLAV